MASINTVVKRKQYIWLGIVAVGLPLPLAEAFTCLTST